MTAPPGIAPTPTRITGTGTKAERAAHRLVRAMKRQGIPPRSATVRALLPVLVDEIDALADDMLDRLVREMPLGLRRPRKVSKRDWAVTS